jgi:hypothetical protein
MVYYSEFSLQNQTGSDRLTTFQSLNIMHLFFEQAFNKAKHYLQLGRPCLVIGYKSGLSTLAQKLAIDCSQSIVIECPFNSSRKYHWKDLFIEGIDVIDGSSVKGQSSDKHRSLDYFRWQFESKLICHEKSIVIIDDAFHLFRSYADNLSERNVSYLKSLFDRKFTFLLQGDCTLLENVYPFFQLSRRIAVIQLSRYKGESGFQEFQKIIHHLQPYLLLDEEPDMSDSQFFYEGSIGHVTLLKLWLERAFGLAIYENAASVEMRHFEKTAIPAEQLTAMLYANLQHEIRVGRILGRT